MNTLPKILIIADGFGVPSYNPRLRALCDYLYAQGYPITVVVEHIADLPFGHDYPIRERSPIGRTASSLPWWSSCTAARRSI